LAARRDFEGNLRYREGTSTSITAELF